MKKYQLIKLIICKAAILNTEIKFVKKITFFDSNRNVTSYFTDSQDLNVGIISYFYIGQLSWNKQWA